MPYIFFFKIKNCLNDDLFISCYDRIGKMLHNICISAVTMSLRLVTCGPWASCFISYNSAATDQQLFIFGMGEPGRVLFHSTSMNSWVMPKGRAKIQNLGHSSEVVYCSVFIQTTS